MKILDKPEFNKAILENLENMDKEPKKDFCKIRKLFPDAYILGGYVRDSILNVLYGYNFPINDLDIIVFDKKFRSKTSCFPKKYISRFGGLKLKYDDFSTDLFSTGNILYLNKNPSLKKNIENVIDGVDLTTSAFAYNISKNEIYCHESAIKDVKKAEVNVLNENSMLPSTISRLIIHSDKFKFKIGENGKNYIRSKYKPEIEKDIINFLTYKEVSHLFPLVKEKLEIILKSH